MSGAWLLQLLFTGPCQIIIEGDFNVDLMSKKYKKKPELKKKKVFWLRDSHGPTRMTCWNTDRSGTNAGAFTADLRTILRCFLPQTLGTGDLTRVTKILGSFAHSKQQLRASAKRNQL